MPTTQYKNSQKTLVVIAMKGNIHVQRYVQLFHIYSNDKN